LSICPRLSRANGNLVAATSLQLRLLTLGLINRRVSIDPKRRMITLSRRLFWFFSRRQRIPFDAIAAISYGYQDWAANSWSWTHKSADLYKVGLRLHSGQEVQVFYFYGEGEFSNQGPLPDWLYWANYQFDVTGTQGQESRLYVELLSKMIGVPVEPSRA